MGVMAQQVLRKHVVRFWNEALFETKMVALNILYGSGSDG